VVIGELQATQSFWLEVRTRKKGPARLRNALRKSLTANREMALNESESERRSNPLMSLNMT
jgi:hypothetical protein